MINAEQIYEKAKTLDPEGLETLAEFLEVLLMRADPGAAGQPFAPTTFEAPDAPSVYQGPPLSLERMREIIDEEAGQRR